jgi:hypothetical protein
VIFSLNLRLSGGTKLTLDLANKLGKPVLHIYDIRKEQISNSDSLRHFLSSNKIEILNVAGPRESKEPGVYDWTLTMLRFLNRAWDPQKQPGEKGWGREEWGIGILNFSGHRYFRLETVG